MDISRGFCSCSHCQLCFLWSLQPLPLFTFTLFSSFPPIFNGSQYTSSYPWPVQLLCFWILLKLRHPLFLFLLPEVSWSSGTVTNMFHIGDGTLSCVFSFMCLSVRSVFPAGEKPCILCVSEPGLLAFTWCAPIADTLSPSMCHSLFLLGRSNCFVLQCGTFFLFHSSVGGFVGCLLNLDL